MPLVPTEAELIELGKKAHALREKDKARARAYSTAVRRLIAAHQEEYEGYLEQAKGR